MNTQRGNSHKGLGEPAEPDTNTHQEIGTAPRDERGAVFSPGPSAVAHQSGRTARRARRLRKLVVTKQAAFAARLAHVGYKTASESGALIVASRQRTWHLGGRANGHAPPPGQAWERSGPVRTTQAIE